MGILTVEIFATNLSVLNDYGENFTEVFFLNLVQQCNSKFRETLTRKKNKFVIVKNCIMHETNSRKI